MRLKNYVFFRETDKGVWFDAGQRSFALNGTGIYPLVERLVSALEQSDQSPHELVANLPEKLRPFAERLFGELEQHKMLQRGVLLSGSSTAHEHSPNSEFLKYLEDNVGDDGLEEVLAQWRKATIVIIGDGYAAKAAAGVLVDSGCGELLIHCLSTGEVAPDELTLSLSGRGNTSINVTAGAIDPEDIDWAVDGLIMAGSDALPVECAIRFTTHGCAAGVKVSASLPINGNLAVLASDRPDASGIADLADWLLAPADPVTPSPENLAIAGSLAAQDLIARFFGIGDDGQTAARIVSPFSEVTLIPIPPSPRRHAEGSFVRYPDFSGRIEMPEMRIISEYERLRIALTPWTEPALAVLGLDMPEALPQLPLYHDAFVVRRPGNGHEAARIAVGWGLSAEDAGIRAATNAIALLAEQEFCNDRPLVAALDEDMWRAAAFARAFVAHDHFQRDAVWGQFDADEIDDPASQMVLDILRFQVSAPISFRVGFVSGVSAIMAACEADGDCLSSVCSPTLEGAVYDAIGLAISKVQLREVAGLVRQDDVPLPVSSSSLSLTGRDSIARAIGSLRTDWPVGFVQSRRLGLPDILSCGYAVLEGQP